MPLQLMGAGGRFVHPVSFLQQLEELLHRHTGVGRTAQGEDLPQQHPEGPAADKQMERQTIRQTRSQQERQSISQTVSKIDGQSFRQTDRWRVSQSESMTVSQSDRQSYSHVTLVGVHSVKKSLGSHPLDRQTTLRKGGGATQLSVYHQQQQLTLDQSERSGDSRLWSSCSSRCGGCPWPGRSQRSSSRCPPSPGRCGPPGPCGCTKPMGKQLLLVGGGATVCPDPVVGRYLFGGKVLHPSSHLEGAGHQVLDRHVFHRNLVWVVAVLHSRRATSSQVLPQVPL